MKLVKLETNAEANSKYIVEICRDILERAEKGDIDQIVIAWIDGDGVLCSSQCGESRLAMGGMLEGVKLTILCPDVVE